MHRLVALMVRHGTPLVWINVFLEQIGLPIPAVPTLILAGALSQEGRMSSTAIIVGSVLASLLADWIWFLLGRKLGYRVLRTICRISLSPDSCVSETEARFERWGMPSLLFAKFIPGFSTVAPPLAGATQRGTAQFLLYDGAGAILWVGAAVAAGRAFHRIIDQVLTAFERLGVWAVVAVALALSLAVLTKWWQRRRFIHRLRLARIQPAELLELMRAEPAPLIFDVRTAAARRRDPRHIPGAVQIAAERIADHLTNIRRDREIILYCT